MSGGVFDEGVAGEIAVRRWGLGEGKIGAEFRGMGVAGHTAAMTPGSGLDGREWLRGLGWQWSWRLWLPERVWGAGMADRQWFGQDELRPAVGAGVATLELEGGDECVDELGCQACQVR